MTIDIEKLKKMNNLIKDLKHQGFADSSNEALNQASNFYNHDLGGVVPENKKPQYEEPKQTSQLETPADSPQISEAYLETKFQLLLEMNNKKFSEEFNRLHSKISMLNDEVSSLRMELRKTEFKQEKPKPKIEEPVQQQQLPVDQKKEDHPRQGKYTSQDVSVEQFFKFGPGGKR